MKDKRQRIAVTWPYAAVYADPSFAASLLQAAANSVSMPYYAQNPMHPPLPGIPPSEAPYRLPYGYRYMPYQMPHRNITSMPSLAHQTHLSPLSTSPNKMAFTRIDGFDSCHEKDYFDSSSSPSNSLSSMSDVEKVKPPRNRIKIIHLANIISIHF